MNGRDKPMSWPHWYSDAAHGIAPPVMTNTRRRYRLISFIRLHHCRARNVLMRNIASALVLALCLTSPVLAQDKAQDSKASSTPAGQDQLTAAVNDTRARAERGEADAQTNLGIIYEKGHGVAQDLAQAVTWYRKAADQGHAPAQYNLGYMYEKGLGIAQDGAQAIAWFRKAADQGYAQAQFRLGVIYREAWLGVARDDAQAAAWFRKAAAQGDAAAQAGLGMMCAAGRGVAPDDAQCAAFRKATEGGGADTGSMHSKPAH